ncbi:MAG: amidohydrolase family protein [Actinomycetota bacterium]|nr:amidohydrolase family protein [Actinomycetota bacterium]
MGKVATGLKVIDVDAHIVEPYDVWTSALGQKWGARVPHVERATRTNDFLLLTRPGDDVWVMGDGHSDDELSVPVGCHATAGWSEPLPSHPPTMDQMHPSAYDPGARLRRMDEYGLYAQVLYPNVGGFGNAGFLALGDPDLKRDCVRVFNDFMHDWCSEDPDRLIPLISTPFWDLEFALDEVERCAGRGHRGILFTWTPEAYGLPYLADPFWDPLWERCAAHEIPVNFHVGSGSFELKLGYRGNGFQVNYARAVTAGTLSNAHALTEVISSGITLRHPRLKFVLVESGVGWVPFVLDMMLWMWQNSGVYQERPELAGHSPLDIFRESIYSTFWFEDVSVKAAVQALGDDHIMFETDYPHSTSVAPGPNVAAKNPIDHIEDRFGGLTLPDDSVRKLLHANAAALYHIA